VSDERGLSMNEFKAVVEHFEAGQKKIIEVMNYRFDKLEGRVGVIEGKIATIERNVGVMKEQLGLVIESQTEMKIEFKNKVDREEFSKLEKRVARLERKVA